MKKPGEESFAYTREIVPRSGGLAKLPTSSTLYRYSAKYVLVAAEETCCARKRQEAVSAERTYVACVDSKRQVRAVERMLLCIV